MNWFKKANHDLVIQEYQKQIAEWQKEKEQILQVSPPNIVDQEKINKLEKNINSVQGMIDNIKNRQKKEKRKTEWDRYYPNNKILAKAVKDYGITDNPKLAGYILPNGQMLNMSGTGYQREFDHGEMARYFPKKDQDQTQGMRTFIARTGAIRVGFYPDSIYVHFSQPPTTAQIETIMKNFNRGSEMAVDVHNQNNEIVMHESIDAGSHLDLKNLIDNGVKMLFEKNNLSSRCYKS